MRAFYALAVAGQDASACDRLPTPAVVHDGESRGLVDPTRSWVAGFTFMGLPLRFRGGHGSPVRAVALIDA